MSSLLKTPTLQRVLIVDGHHLVRHGLTELINCEPDLIVCAATATHDDALEAIVTTQPDLVITELAFEKENGLDLVKDIRSAHKSLPILVLSMQDAPSYAELALRAGANGYVSKRELTETLMIAIRDLLTPD